MLKIKTNRIGSISKKYLIGLLTFSIAFQSLVFAVPGRVHAADCFAKDLTCAARNVIPTSVQTDTANKCRLKLAGDAPALNGHNINQSALKITISEQSGMNGGAGSAGSGTTSTSQTIGAWTIDYVANSSSVVNIPSQGGGFYDKTTFNYFSSPNLDCSKTYTWKIETLDGWAQNAPVIGTLVGNYKVVSSTTPGQATDPGQAKNTQNGGLSTENQANGGLGNPLCNKFSDSLLDKIKGLFNPLGYLICILINAVQDMTNWFMFGNKGTPDKPDENSLPTIF